MNIQSIQIKNFLAIGDAVAKLDQRGLVLIQGENRDDTSQESNGAGKSSLADAISWCLYGVTARGETGDRIVNRVAKKNTHVEIRIKEDDVGYKIARYRKHTRQKNRLTVHVTDADGKTTDLTKGTDKLTQELVVKIMGCSEDVFTSAIYAGQENMPSLPDMTDKLLKTLIEEAAGITELANAHVIAKERHKAILSDLEKAQMGSEAVKTSMTDLSESRLAIKEKQKAWDITTKATYVELKRSTSEAKATLVKSLKGFNACAESATDQEKKVIELNVKLASLNDQKAFLANLQGQERHEGKIMDAANRDLQSMKKKITQTEKAIKDVNSRIGEPCLDCDRPITEKEIEGILKTSNATLVDQQSALEAHQICFDLADKVHAEAFKEEQTYRESMTDASATVSELEVYKTALKKREDQKKALKDQAQRVKANEETLSAPPTESPYMDILDDMRTKRESLDAKFEVLAKQEEEFDDRAAILKKVVELYSPAGVRAYILDTVTPFLNERTGEYLSALTDGNIDATWSTISLTSKSEMREKFSIKVESKLGAQDFKGLSGGEKRKVRLATSMALQDLVASRATKPIQLFIADEIDHALDEAGLERLMSILRDKATECGTVLVISHNSLSDWISSSVTMVKQDGLTSIEGVAL